MAFLIFAFFFQMAVAFEGSFLTYYMADIQIDTVNLGLILSVRAMMEIPFLFFIGRLRRLFRRTGSRARAPSLKKGGCALWPPAPGNPRRGRPFF